MKAIVAALAIGQSGVAARKFWTSKPADPGNVLLTGYTIGNGRQGGKEVGDTAVVTTGLHWRRFTAGNTWR